MSTPPTTMPASVSIVIPMYNAAPWIVQTLESVACQTLNSTCLEVIAVDDGSDDDSVMLAQTFFRQNSINGKVIALARNAGVSSARNVGWRAAAGEWVQFLDADDLLAPGKLEIQGSRAS